MALVGPANETCGLLYIPIGKQAGLHLVHPTWAGTFVLAALTRLFPRTQFVLLDSDCIPVMLFEVADLWKEASLIKDNSLLSIQPTRRGSSISFSSTSLKVLLRFQKLVLLVDSLHPLCKVSW